MERLRRALRPLLGANSRSWRAAAWLAANALLLRRTGWQGWRATRSLQRAPAGPARQLSLRPLAHPIWVRPGTDDVQALIDNAVRDEWGTGFPSGYSPQRMIDGGAFIGDSAAVFLSRFPRLRVLAVEPNPVNMAMARRNLAPYGDRAKLIQAALWHEDATLSFAGDSIHGGIAEQGDIEVPAISLPRLIASEGHVDILKLDIEGAEEALFEHQPEVWLPSVDHLLIELHSPAIAGRILPMLRQSGFVCRLHRSVWHCTRLATT